MLATELINMRIRKTGAIHFIITTNMVLDLKDAPFLVTSSIIAFGLMINPTKIQVNNAQIGIRMLLLIKSMMSSTDMPIHEINERGPKPRQDGIPIIREKVNTIPHALCLLQFVLSQKIETMVSISDIEEVKAAKNTK